MKLPKFLRRWFAVVRQVAAAQLHTGEGSSLVPRVSHIDVRLPRQTTRLPMFRQALIIVSLALQVDFSLWINFRLKIPTNFYHRRVTQRVDAHLFRPQDLTPAFEIVHGDFTNETFLSWIEKLKLLLIDEGDDNVFHTAKGRLQAANTWSDSGDKQALVSLRIEDLGTDPPLAALASTLESVTSCSGAQPPLLWISHISLHIRQLNDALSSAVARIRALGIVVHCVDVEDAGFVDDFDQCLATLCAPSAASGDADPHQLSPLKNLTLKYDIYDPVAPALAKTLLNCRHTPTSVEVVMHRSDYVDWKLVCKVLCATTAHTRVSRLHIAMPNMWPHRLGQLRSALDVVRLSGPNTPVRVTPGTRPGRKLRRELGVANVDANTTLSAMIGAKTTLLVLPNGQIVVAPRASVVLADVVTTEAELTPQEDTEQGIRSVCMLFGPCDFDGIPTLLSFLGLCFPIQLVSLELEVATGAKISAADIAAILDTFPLLQCLKLRPTDLTTMEVFLDAYRSGRCKLSVISVDAGHIGFLPFLEELASPTSVAASTLRELKIGFAEDLVEYSTAFLHAMKRMLEQNHALEFLQLVVTTECKLPVTEIAATLERFHRQPLPTVSAVKMPLASKLTFLGAMTSSQPDEKLRKTIVAKTVGRGTLYTTVVDDELMAMRTTQQQL